MGRGRPSLATQAIGGDLAAGSIREYRELEAGKSRRSYALGRRLHGRVSHQVALGPSLDLGAAPAGADARSPSRGRRAMRLRDKPDCPAAKHRLCWGPI